MHKLLRSISTKFITRISVTWLLILFAVLFPATLFATRQVSKISQDKNLQYSQLVLQNIDNDLQSEIDSIHEMVLHLNQQNGTMAYLRQTGAGGSAEDIENYRSFLTSFNSLFLLNRNLAAVEVYKCADGTYYRFSRAKSLYISPHGVWPEAVTDLSRQYTQQLQVEPSYFSSEANSMCYNVLSNFKSTVSLENSAVLRFVMDTSGFSKLLKSYYDNGSRGTVYILSPDGQLLYDSSSLYSAGSLPVSRLLEERPARLTVRRSGQPVECYANYSSENELGYLVFELIPISQHDAPVEAINRVVLLSFGVAALLTALLTLLSNTVFSRRILILTQALGRIRKGDLSVRIPPAARRDEFSEVGESINQMCADLQKYIDRVYLAELERKNTELKLKSTELRTLQAQINPHFLYNTLEMIRMKLNLEGQRECGDMVMLLSKLLRSSIKSAAVVSLEEELQSAKLFLRLYQLRFPDLTVDFELDEELLPYAAARNIFQPVLENCVTHAYREDRPLHVCVSGKLEEGMVRLCVVDNGTGIGPAKLGQLNKSLAAGENDTTEHIGIFNVNNRLKLLFGPESGLRLESEPQKGTQVWIVFRAKQLEEFEEYV